MIYQQTELFERPISLSALLEPVLAPPSLGVFDGLNGKDLEFVDEAA
jgi:hypothetical protein